MISILIALLIWLLALTIAITIHEASHAYAAVKLGDPTPQIQDRLTLNPLAHYDTTGTSLLLITAVGRALGFPIIPFGWAKPVMFDPYNLQNPRRDAAIISLAGPASNFLLAIIMSLIIRVLPDLGLISAFLGLAGEALITLNVALGIFNLIPIHPLDGGKILVGILPNDVADEADQILNRYGFIILILLIFPFSGTSAVTALISPAIEGMLRLLIP